MQNSNLIPLWSKPCNHPNLSTYMSRELNQPLPSFLWKTVTRRCCQELLQRMLSESYNLLWNNVEFRSKFSSKIKVNAVHIMSFLVDAIYHMMPKKDFSHSALSWSPQSFSDELPSRCKKAFVYAADCDQNGCITVEELSRTLNNLIISQFMQSKWPLFYHLTVDQSSARFDIQLLVAYYGIHSAACHCPTRHLLFPLHKVWLSWLVHHVVPLHDSILSCWIAMQIDLGDSF